MRLETAAGARALVTRSIAAYGHRVTLMLVGERGALRAGWSGAMDVDTEPEVELSVHDGDGAERIAVARETGHAFDVPKQTAAFLAAIERGEPVPADGADGRASVALSLAVEDSLARGSAVVELG